MRRSHRYEVSCICCLHEEERGKGWSLCHRDINHADDAQTRTALNALKVATYIWHVPATSKSPSIMKQNQHTYGGLLRFFSMVQMHITFIYEEIFHKSYASFGNLRFFSGNLVLGWFGISYQNRIAYGDAYCNCSSASPTAMRILFQIASPAAVQIAISKAHRLRRSKFLFQNRIALGDFTSTPLLK